MKLLVVSDSHGYTAQIYKAIEREQPQAVLHLGDHYKDAAELRYAYPQLPVYAIRGNNDWQGDDTACICLAGVQIYMTHGHLERCHGSSVGKLPMIATEKNCKLALYGHTHRMQLQTVCGVTIVNPGSTSRPRGGCAGYAVITLTDGMVDTVEFRDTNGIAAFPAP